MDTSVRITEKGNRLDLTLKGERAVFKNEKGEISIRISELQKIFKIHLDRIKREKGEELDSIVGE